MMSRPSGRGDAASRERRRRNGERDRLTRPAQTAIRPAQTAKNVDPIFSSPYEPAPASAAPRRPAPAQRAPRQVAALLCGLPKGK
jgi:hypothetical protein